MILFGRDLSSGPPLLEAEELRRILHYDPDTGVFTWLYVGTFKTEEEAHLAYREAARHLYGNYARFE